MEGIKKWFRRPKVVKENIPHSDESSTFEDPIPFCVAQDFGFFEDDNGELKFDFDSFKEEWNTMTDQVLVSCSQDDEFSISSSTFEDHDFLGSDLIITPNATKPEDVKNSRDLNWARSLMKKLSFKNRNSNDNANKTKQVATMKGEPDSKRVKKRTSSLSPEVKLPFYERLLNQGEDYEKNEIVSSASGTEEITTVNNVEDRRKHGRETSVDEHSNSRSQKQHQPLNSFLKSNVGHMNEATNQEEATLANPPDSPQNASSKRDNLNRNEKSVTFADKLSITDKKLGLCVSAEGFGFVENESGIIAFDDAKMLTATAVGRVENLKKPSSKKKVVSKGTKRRDERRHVARSTSASFDYVLSHLDPSYRIVPVEGRGTPVGIKPSSFSSLRKLPQLIADKEACHPSERAGCSAKADSRDLASDVYNLSSISSSSSSSSSRLFRKGLPFKNKGTSLAFAKGKTQQSRKKSKRNNVDNSICVTREKCKGAYIYTLNQDRQFSRKKVLTVKRGLK